MGKHKTILLGILALVFTLVVIPQLTFAKSITAKKIENISVTVQQDAKYNLPTTVKALMSNNQTRNLAVKWDVKLVNTNASGTFKYNGTVNGYGKKIVLSVKILGTKKPTATETQTSATSSIKSKPTPAATTPPADGVSSATATTTN